MRVERATGGTALPGARLLDLLVAATLVLAALLLLPAMTPQFDPSALLTYQLVYGTLLLATTAVWVLMRARGLTPTMAFLFALLGLTVTIVADRPYALPVLLPSMIVISLTFGRVGTLVLSGSMLVFVVVFGTLAGGVAALLQVPVIALVLAIGLAVGWFVESYARELWRAEALAVELRQRAEVERELVLAEERARAARELHDGLGHRLVSLSMGLSFAERARESAPDRAWQEVSVARELAGETLTEMRRWVRALAPVHSPGAEGADALDALAESFRGTGLTIEVQSAGSRRAPSEPIELFTRRFCQEALTNALRHGSPSMIGIEWNRTETELRISVTDDGEPAGPTEAQARSDPPSSETVPVGFGIRSLTERAEALGGRVAAGHRNDAGRSPGFVITAVLPLPDSPRAPVGTRTPDDQGTDRR